MENNNGLFSISASPNSENASHTEQHSHRTRHEVMNTYIRLCFIIRV